MRLHWEAIYDQDGHEVLGAGSNPSYEVVPANKCVCTFQLHDGVISHEAARHLETAGYHFDLDQTRSPAVAALQS